ncbi:hypothetical protein CLD_1855 [Clostridium botulinum B1 str. Okra]|uniref:DegT/DnrJ/EryC1/StrS aminotransferase family protein n=2 Tax=Clostridium botulinum TaxID=1491 RepID=B1IK47_CLOBK|nr:hypothetical protein CLD_1855 [Clostridium botulinum B1 str. Okra]
MKPIGGELWFDEIIFNDAENNFQHLNAVFLNGGQSAIQFIIEDIDFKEDEHVLMPSYLCPTILYNFQRSNIKFIFYEVNEDLSIDLKDMENKINQYKVRTVYFIDYFGFYHNDNVIDYLRKIQKTGVILVEDAVQMLWFSKQEKFIGDYVFNSYRKFLPIDGSVVLCNKSMELGETKDRYYELIHEARTKKTAYVKSNIGSEEEFLKLFAEADEAYYQRRNASGMDSKSKKLLNKVKHQQIKQLRIDNYNYLHEKLTDLNDVKVMFNKELITDNVPLTLPIMIKNRNFVRKELRKHSIYCPVHWNIENEKWASVLDKSRKVSSSILSIPIDWRYDKKDMHYILEQLISII